MALVGHISGSIQSNSVIGISGSVIVANRPDSLFPSMAGTDVTFFVSGSADGTGRAVFGGDLISSGSFNLKTGTGGASQFSVSSTGMLINTAAGTNSVDINASTGNITTTGDIAVNGGDITTGAAVATIFNSTATTLAIGSGATTGLSIGAPTGVVTVAGDLKVSGNDIQSSTATAITLSAANVTVAGDLRVNGNDILSSTGATVFTLSDWNVSIPNGNLTVAKNVTVAGDLTVNGTMSTINTTNLEVKDSVIGLGFSSGTIALPANGDRGWIGSNLTGIVDTHVMSKWDNTNSEFVFARTSSSATGSFGISSYSNLHTNNIQANIVSASLGFSGSLTQLMDGTSYMIAGSGISISSASNGPVTISIGSGVGDVTGPASSTQYAVALFDDTTGKVLRNSGLVSDGTGNVLTVTADLTVNGNTDLGNATTDTITFTARADSSLLPITDNLYDLGSANNRWANVYTGDLHLRNDRGDYTLIEEEDMLTIRFNKTGKRYKFLLEAVPHLDEEPSLKF